MNLISTLKTLPLVGILAMGLALTPAVAMADKGERSYSKGHKSHNNTFRSSNKGHYNKHKNRHQSRHNDRGHRYNSHNKHVYNNHYARGDGHHPRRYYTHNNYYVRDYGHYDRYDTFDNVRFMFGLHTGNFDIIFRD